MFYNRREPVFGGFFNFFSPNKHKEKWILKLFENTVYRKKE